MRIAPILFRLHVSRDESFPFKNFSSPSRTSLLKILDLLIIHGSKKWQKNPWKLDRTKELKQNNLSENKNLIYF